MRRRRMTLVLTLIAMGVAWFVYSQPGVPAAAPEPAPAAKPALADDDASARSPAMDALNALPVKGKAPKTGYARTQFGSGWATAGGCDTRNVILQRDLTNTVVSDDCKVMSGTLDDPYTGKVIAFTRGVDTSADVQIDHVVALSNAWQTGAQQLTPERRTALANDPLELIAVDGGANQQKSDGDAATWLPANKAFRCQYIARQIAVKTKYNLYVTAPEKAAMQRILTACPAQLLP